MTNLEKSQNHIDFIASYEYFILEVNGLKLVYRAPEIYPVKDMSGSRDGRWFCNLNQWEDYLELLKGIE